MKQIRVQAAKLLAASLLALAAFATGCSTPDENELSERPWNAPKSWETGVPQSMLQGR